MDSLTPSHADIIETISRQTTSFQLPEQIRDTYRIHDFLKRTSNKEIYEVTDNNGNRYILKYGTGEQAACIRQEHNILEQLAPVSGLNLPRCAYYLEDEKGCYLLRQYIEGCSLTEYMDSRLYFTDVEVIDFMLDICNIIQILHEQDPPIIHRDIKPENFIVQKGTGLLYLVDLDTARQFAPDKSRDTKLMGTPAHAAPEQFGFSQSDIRTDIYALGKTMLYLACGTTDDSAPAQRPLPSAFEKIIQQCLSFSPDNRYRDIHALKQALHHERRRLLRKTTGINFPVVICLLFLFGVLGYAIGSRIPVSHTGNSRNATALTPSQKNREITTDPEQAANAEVPLSQQTDIIPFDVYLYRDDVDQILLDYYNERPEDMAKHCEDLIRSLYADKTLMRTAGTDYSEKGYIDKDETWEIPGIYVRNSLAYRDEILKKKLGSYTKYSNIFYSCFNEVLNETLNPEDTSLYLYVSSSGKEAEEAYPNAFHDIIMHIRNAIDNSEDLPILIEDVPIGEEPENNP